MTLGLSAAKGQLRRCPAAPAQQAGARVWVPPDRQQLRSCMSKPHGCTAADCSRQPGAVIQSARRLSSQGSQYGQCAMHALVYQQPAMSAPAVAAGCTQHTCSCRCCLQHVAALRCEVTADCGVTRGCASTCISLHEVLHAHSARRSATRCFFCAVTIPANDQQSCVECRHNFRNAAFSAARRAVHIRSVSVARHGRAPVQP